MTWRRTGSEDRSLAWLWFATAAAGLLAVPLAPYLAVLVPGCPMREWTGTPCPTCGSTRALLALADARFGAALRFNPLAALATIVFAAGGLVAPLWVRLRGPLPVFPSPWPWIWRAAVAAIVVANWAYLIVAGV